MATSFSAAMARRVTGVVLRARRLNTACTRTVPPTLVLRTSAVCTTRVPSTAGVFAFQRRISSTPSPVLSSTKDEGKQADDAQQPDTAEGLAMEAVDGTAAAAAGTPERTESSKSTESNSARQSRQATADKPKQAKAHSEGKTKGGSDKPSHKRVGYSLDLKSKAEADRLGLFAATADGAEGGVDALLTDEDVYLDQLLDELFEPSSSLISRIEGVEGDQVTLEMLLGEADSSALETELQRHTDFSEVKAAFPPKDKRSEYFFDLCATKLGRTAQLTPQQKTRISKRVAKLMTA